MSCCWQLWIESVISQCFLLNGCATRTTDGCLQQLYKNSYLLINIRSKLTLSRCLGWGKTTIEPKQKKYIVMMVGVMVMTMDIYINIPMRIVFIITDLLLYWYVCFRFCERVGRRWRSSDSWSGSGLHFLIRKYFSVKHKSRIFIYLFHVYYVYSYTRINIVYLWDDGGEI